MLAGVPLVAFTGVTDLERAHAFYGGVLGLRRVAASAFANEYAAPGGGGLRVTLVERAVAAGYTVAGWRVEDVGAVVEALRAAGVEVERYPGLDQDRAGIWTAPGQSRVAWFRDPDGNVLSVQQPPG